MELIRVDQVTGKLDALLAGAPGNHSWAGASAP